jgi:hypothetical protein
MNINVGILRSSSGAHPETGAQLTLSFQPASTSHTSIGVYDEDEGEEEEEDDDDIY